VRHAQRWPLAWTASEGRACCSKRQWLLRGAAGDGGEPSSVLLCWRPTTYHDPRALVGIVSMAVDDDFGVALPQSCPHARGQTGDVTEGAMQMTNERLCVPAGWISRMRLFATPDAGISSRSLSCPPLARIAPHAARRRHPLQILALPKRGAPCPRRDFPLPACRRSCLTSRQCLVRPGKNAPLQEIRHFDLLAFRWLLHKAVAGPVRRRLLMHHAYRGHSMCILACLLNQRGREKK
jgi:hypothetical protein